MARDRVTVYYSRISGIFKPGGEIFGEMRKMGNYNALVAKKIAPKRTGNLAESIKIPVPVTPSGMYDCRYTVRARTPYALYVSLGTTGPITAKNGALLWVRPRPHPWYSWKPQFASVAHGRTPRFSVQGQAANSYLQRSLVITLKRARVI
jgi:hypothetical protein